MGLPKTWQGLVRLYASCERTAGGFSTDRKVRMGLGIGLLVSMSVLSPCQVSNQAGPSSLQAGPSSLQCPRSSVQVNPSSVSASNKTILSSLTILQTRLRSTVQSSAAIQAFDSEINALLQQQSRSHHFSEQSTHHHQSQKLSRLSARTQQQFVHSRTGNTHHFTGISSSEYCKLLLPCSSFILIVRIIFTNNSVFAEAPCTAQYSIKQTICQFTYIIYWRAKELRRHSSHC